MDTIDAIRQRRAIKHYDPDHRLTEAEIDELMDLAVQSPTSFNMQNWRFVLVTDPDLRAQIRAAAMDQAHVTDASLLVVLCADVHAFKRDPARYWSDAPQEVQDLLVPWITPFYEGNEQLQRDEGIRSVGIAAQTLMLAAKAMGYDSCPMIGFDAAAVGELINLPDDHLVGMFVTIGKAIQPAWPKPGRVPRDEVVIRERFA